MGMLVLTDTRIVYLQKKQGETFIDCEFSRDAITGLRFTIQIGGRQLSIEHDGEWFVAVGEKHELEPFVEPLRQNAATNVARFKNEENGSAKRTVDSIDGHETAVVGEPVLLAARATSGWGSGAIILTDTRLVYLRKKKNVGTYIDRETDRTSILNVRYAKSMASWDIRFDDGSDEVIYIQTSDDLEPFVEPLQASAEANASSGIHNGHVANEIVDITDRRENNETDPRTNLKEGEELILDPLYQRIIVWIVIALIVAGIFFFVTNSCNDSIDLNDPCMGSVAAQEACADRLGRQMDAFDRSKADGHSNDNAWATSEATR